MKHPLVMLLAIAISVILWGIAKSSKGTEVHHNRGHQSPPLEVLGRPVNCGALDNHIQVLRKKWKIDKKLMRKGLFHPIFEKDRDDLYYFEELFWLVPCSRA